MPKYKQVKLDVKVSEESTTPSFLIDLKSSQDKAAKLVALQEEKKLKSNFFSNYKNKKSVSSINSWGRSFFTKKKPLNLKERWQSRIIGLFPQKRSRSNFSYLRISWFRPRRHRRVWQRKLKDFSRVVHGGRFHYYQKITRQPVAKQEKKQNLLLSWYRSIFTFIIVLVLIIIPFKLLNYWRVIDLSSLEEKLLLHSQAAISNLSSAKEAIYQLDLQTASSDFSAATDDLVAANQLLNPLNDWLLSVAALSSDPKIKLASASKNFLAAGTAATSMAENLSLAFGPLLEREVEGEVNWLLIIDNFYYYGQQALVDADNLIWQLSKIDPQVLPENYRPQFIEWQSATTTLRNSLASLLDSVGEIKNLLGISQDRRYLLVFQNNTEMRGSGGFLGSYALLDIKEGGIKNLEVPAGGTYDTEAGLRTFVRAPRPLWLVNPRWYFWDANWWPDWPTTAQNLMWFYEKSDGPTVDGVISFTPDVLVDLLKITGPIDLTEDYGVEITADNFWLLLQSIVEKDNLVLTHPEFVAGLPDSPNNQPKKIIGDLFEKLLTVLPEKLTLESLPQLTSLIEKNLQQKNILFYFTDPDLQTKLADWGLDGAIRQTSHDYLLVAHTNIAGQKTDLKIKETMFLDSQILTDGRIVNQLTIVREHQGIKNEPLSGVRNVDWLRVYVPAGSRLLSASGFSQPDDHYFEYPEEDWLIHPVLAKTEELAALDPESGVQIYQESGKTVFANWTMTNPGETTTIKIKYLLPLTFSPKTISDDHWLSQLLSVFKVEPTQPAVHSLLVQKQPGLLPVTFFSRLRLPANWEVYWRHPSDLSGTDPWLVKTLLDRDRGWAILALPK